MIALTPLEQALVAFSRDRDPDAPGDRQGRVDDAVALAETETFSVQHIILITGLPKTFAYELLAGKNPRKEGGSLNVEHLPLINDVAIDWRRHRSADRRVVATIVDGGTSPRMLAKLTGIHYNTIYAWMRKKEANASDSQPKVAAETPNAAD
ncbi:MAG: hypothetical protein K0S70_100 [Microbacterium sp.]|jgi:hypothetical protein|nr:hypothetical protein [Microbacterium sp.]